MAQSKLGVSADADRAKTETRATAKTNENLGIADLTHAFQLAITPLMMAADHCSLRTVSGPV